MAFIKETTLKGMPIPKAYHKITSIFIEEVGTEEVSGEKLYTAKTTITSYTDETKEHELGKETYTIENLKEVSLSLENIYINILKLEQFQGAENI